MKLIYAKPQQRRYSVERLRSLYTRLLRYIDINVDELCPRGMEDDIDAQKGTGWDTIFTSYVAMLQPKQHQRPVGQIRSDKRKQELDRAFREIAAMNPVGVVTKMHGSNDSMGETEEVSRNVLREAQKMETIVVQIIYDIGDIVVNAQRPSSESTSELRSDDVFAYFCEKAILSMLVEIMMDQPHSSQSGVNNIAVEDPIQNQSATNSFNGVAWSPKVKAQILQTVVLLLANVRDRSAIYYLLSQHCMNQLIVHLLPLSQWTESALRVMVCPFIDLLKILSMQLSGSPDLFPLYTVDVRLQDHPNQQLDSKLSFPLFTTIIQLTKEKYVQSDSYIYATCLNIVVGLLKISDPTIRTWISTNADVEQALLCTHLTQESSVQYRRIVNLATGPVVDAERSKAIAMQLDTFNDQIDIYNDIFYCNIQSLNVRLCETLLQEFIRHIVQYIVPGQGQNFFQVGISDRDVIPLREARVQVALLLLSRLFANLEYGPFIRMLAVTLLHPKSTPFWQSKDVRGHTIMSTLSKIVQNDQSVDTIPNVFRNEALKILSGEYGEWLVVPVSALFENALTAIDDETLKKLMLLPNIFSIEGSECSIDTLENPLILYLDQKHEYKSIVSTIALESVTSLATRYMIKVAAFSHSAGRDFQRFDLYFRTSTLVDCINTTMLYFFEQTLQALHVHNVNDIIISFVESVVQARYKHTVSSPKRKITSQNNYVYSLYPYGPNAYCKGPDPLIRKLIGPQRNDVEVYRFNITMALHFRAIHRILRRLHHEESQFYDSKQDGEQVARSDISPVSLDEFELIDEADELSSIFCCLQEKPSVGTDLDLQGRMKFNFTVHGIKDESKRDNGHPEQRMRTFSEDMMFRETSDLILVLDATSIIVARPMFPQQRSDVDSAPSVLERSIIVCYIPLLDVIFAACDHTRLHIAVRHENVNCLIRNGNMIVTLDSPGTCCIVHQYLEKCRKLLREEMHKKIIKLFSTNVPILNDRKTEPWQKAVDSLELPQAKTF